MIDRVSAATNSKILSQILGNNNESDGEMLIKEKPISASFKKGNRKCSGNSAEYFSVCQEVWFQNEKYSFPVGKSNVRKN